MPLYQVSPGNYINAEDINQFVKLLTGVMTDQAVTLGNLVTIKNSIGSAPFAFHPNYPVGGDLTIRASSIRLILSGPTAGYLTSNAYFDGTNWQRFNTANAAAVIITDNTGNIQFATGPSGANPLSLTTRMRIYQSGGVFIGSSPSDPGTNNLTVQGTIRTRGQLYVDPTSGNAEIVLAQNGTNRMIIYSGGSGILGVFDVAAGASRLYLENGLLKVGADLLPVQRHPYSNNRHVESGKVSVSGAANPLSVSVTFTNAFASAPVVVALWEDGGSGGNRDGCATTGVSTTGFSYWQNSGGSSHTGSVAWIAEGVD